MSLITLPDPESIFQSPVSPRQFGSDNWGKVNRFDLVLDGPGVGLGQPFAQTPIARSFRMVFVDGVAWADTPFYAVAAGKIRKGQTLWRCTTEAALLTRLETDVRALHASMAAHGFLSQESIAKTLASGEQASRLSAFAEDGYHSTIRPSHNIKIGLNEDGAALFLDGRHRLAMALTLGLRNIPVRVVFRHARWQALRDALSALPPGPLAAAHPDLAAFTVTDADAALLQQRMASGALPRVAFQPVG